jgi:alpha-mannosidase
MVKVYIDHQVLPAGKSFTILDDTGRPVAMQPLESREEGTYWVLRAVDVPAFGYASYRIIQGKEPRVISKSAFNGILENEYYRLKINPAKGSIESLFDKQLGKELADPTSAYQPGQFIYERLGKNRHQLEVLKLDEVTRTVLRDVHVSSDFVDGPIWQSISLYGSSPECAEKDGISCEIRLYKSEKKIEFLYSLKKLPVTDPEGGYVAFPFKLDNGHLVFEVQGGTVRPGKDQLEGSSSDWNGIQNFASVKNDNSQIILVSPEIPLVQLGGLNLGQFSRIAHPASNNIYSWVFNNYWTTNFRAYQEGELKWTYKLTSTKDTSDEFSTTFGWNERVPMPARVFPALGKDSSLSRKSFIPLQNNFLLVKARPSDEKNGVVLQIREIGGIASSLVWNDLISNWTGLQNSTGAVSAFEVNVLEDKIAQIYKRLEFKPFETKFVKVVLN